MNLEVSNGLGGGINIDFSQPRPKTKTFTRYVNFYADGYMSVGYDTPERAQDNAAGTRPSRVAVPITFTMEVV